MFSSCNYLNILLNQRKHGLSLWLSLSFTPSCCINLLGAKRQETINFPHPLITNRSLTSLTIALCTITVTRPRITTQETRLTVLLVLPLTVLAGAPWWVLARRGSARWQQEGRERQTEGGQPPTSCSHCSSPFPSELCDGTSTGDHGRNFLRECCVLLVADLRLGNLFSYLLLPIFVLL